MADKESRVIAWARARPELTAFLLLFLFSFLVRLWPVLAIRQSWEDAYFYIELARALARGKFELMGSFHAKYLPGYPAAILFAHTLGLGLVSWFKSAQLVSALASSAIPGLTFLLTQEITRDRGAAWAAGLMAALNAQLVTLSGVPFAETLFTAQVMLSLYLIPRAPLAGGVLAGFAALTRHEGLFLAPVFILVALAEKKKWPRPALGLALLLLIAGTWWLLAHHETGKWLYQVYLDEAVERGPTMPRPGYKFLLLSLPVAGHLVTLFAVPGLYTLARARAGRPALLFFVLYSLLHGFWMFGVERYYLPLVPIIAASAGVGLWTVARAARRNFRYLLPGLGALAGAVHFLGFAPVMIQEEATRTSGYLEAILYVAHKPGEFSILAYDAFMVAYHAGDHPVFPSGMLAADSWGYAIPQLYAESGLRYIIWSDFYPADREKLELSEPQYTEIPGQVTIAGQPQQVLIEVAPDKVFEWTWTYPGPGWLLPWRTQVPVPAKAIVFRLELMPPE